MAVSLLLLLSVASMTAGNRLLPFRGGSRRMKVFACEGSSLSLSCRQIRERIVLGVGEINDRQRALRLVTEEGVGAPSLPRSAPASEICL